MAAAKKTNSDATRNQVYADPSGAAPNTEPQGSNWDYERLTSGLHSSIQALTIQSTEVKGAVNRNTSDLCEVRLEIKEFREKSLKNLEDSVLKIDKTMGEHLSFVRGAKWLLGIGTIAVVSILGFTWSSVIQPGIAKAIADQIKPELTSHIKDTIEAQAQKAALDPKPLGKK